MTHSVIHIAVNIEFAGNSVVDRLVLYVNHPSFAFVASSIIVHSGLDLSLLGLSLAHWKETKRRWRGDLGGVRNMSFCGKSFFMILSSMSAKVLMKVWCSRT